MFFVIKNQTGIDTASYQHLTLTRSNDSAGRAFISLFDNFTKEFSYFIIFNRFEGNFSIKTPNIHLILGGVLAYSSIEINALSVSILGPLIVNNGSITIFGKKNIINKSPLFIAEKSEFLSEEKSIFTSQSKEDATICSQYIWNILTRRFTWAENFIALLIRCNPTNTHFHFPPLISEIPLHFLTSQEPCKAIKAILPILAFPITILSRNEPSTFYIFDRKRYIKMSIQTINGNYMITCGEQKFYLIYKWENFDLKTAQDTFVIFASLQKSQNDLILEGIKGAIFIESFGTEKTISIQQDSQFENSGTFYSLTGKKLSLGSTNVCFLPKLRLIKQCLQELAFNPTINWKKTFHTILYYLEHPFIQENIDEDSFFEKIQARFNINPSFSLFTPYAQLHNSILKKI